MLHITVDNRHQFEVAREGDTLMLNGTAVEWDIVQIAPHRYHILLHGRSYNAELVSHDTGTKTIVFKINGQLCPVTVKDRMDMLLEKMGLSGAQSTKVADLKAPMPGLILQVLVAVGDTVKKGDPLLILEAMKMENVLKAPADAVISKINVKQGERTEKNHLLIAFA